MVLRRATTSGVVALLMCLAAALGGCSVPALPAASRPSSPSLHARASAGPWTAFPTPKPTPTPRPKPTATPTPRPSPTPLTPIKHIVLIVQENRSFDDLFARFPGADGAAYGLSHTGKRIYLQQRKLAEPDIDHGYFAFRTEYDNGKMDGFDEVSYGGTQYEAGTYPYQYVDPREIAPYWTLAKRYVLADHMFQTQAGGSFTAHQDLIAGGTPISWEASLVDVPTHEPWGCDAPPETVTSLLSITGEYLAGKGPFPCFSYPTIRDLLDAKGVSWRYYSPALASGDAGYFWNAFDAIKAVRRGPEWTTKISTPETNIFRDIRNDRLAAVTWLIPDAVNSDHPGHIDNGPSWVAAVIDSIGKRRWWYDTAIIVVWDDWGGFYDNEEPPFRDRSGGLGFRVPALIVGPYARSNFVDHTPYEFGSILTFIEDNWDLGRLGTSDVRANSLGHAFDFTQSPRPFEPIPADVPVSAFEHAKPSGIPVDDQ